MCVCVRAGASVCVRGEWDVTRCQMGESSMPITQLVNHITLEIAGERNAMQKEVLSLPSEIKMNK